MHSAQTFISDLELELLPQEAGYRLMFRFQRADDRVDHRSGPFTVHVDEAHLHQVATDPEAYGAVLTAQVFAEAGASFREALSFAAGGELQVRLRLMLPATLQHIRWETLQEPGTRHSLARNGKVLLSRYIASNELLPVHAPPRDRFRAVVAVAAPKNIAAYRLASIDPTAELARARRVLGHTALVTLGDLQGNLPTWDELNTTLRAGCDIFYLVAHGQLQADSEADEPEPWLFLVDREHAANRRAGRELVELLRNLSERRPLLVVLASCESAGDGFDTTLAALGPQLARAGVPAVVAMQGKVAILTAERFATVLFEELRRDGLIDRAVNVARLAVASQPDWWMPVLYTRLRDGRLGLVQEQEGHPSEAPTNLESSPEREHKRELLDANKAQLRELELTAARFGLYTPPYINVEIRRLKRAILALKHELER